MRHISTELAKRGVYWVFNPPGGSHHGGVFERMIGIVRRVLEVVIGSQTLSDDSLSTFFCEVESTINSRPLIVVSNDVNDLCPITPNSLLNLDNYVVTLDSEEMFCESRKKLRQVQHLAKEFWRRWLKEYLPCLQERQKWLKVNRNLKEGDIVLKKPHGPTHTAPHTQPHTLYVTKEGYKNKEEKVCVMIVIPTPSVTSTHQPLGAACIVIII
ncbi:uncharacterized protein LOC143017998 [Oratosquilla oratoria]|uniref:uncharacterized protein LOC143017998 n=1 Tax=Oratosquilla oratoria TaxID=337810 RepID=UPI003F75E9C0